MSSLIMRLPIERKIRCTWAIVLFYKKSFVSLMRVGTCLCMYNTSDCQLRSELKRHRHYYERFFVTLATTQPRTGAFSSSAPISGFSEYKFWKWQIRYRGPHFRYCFSLPGSRFVVNSRIAYPWLHSKMLIRFVYFFRVATRTRMRNNNWSFIIQIIQLGLFVKFYDIEWELSSNEKRRRDD